MTIDDLTIDIPIDDIAMGVDPDGLPKTVPGKGAGGTGGAPAEGKPAGKAGAAEGGAVAGKGEGQRKAKAEPRQPTIAELEAARRERDAKGREAAAAMAEAQAARALADTEAKARGEAEGALLKTRGQALNEYYSRIAGELSQITSAIASTEALATSAQSALQAAMADENATADVRAARVAKAQRELSRAEAELVQLESGKSGAERAVAEAKWYLEEEARNNASLTAARAEDAKAKAQPKGQAGAVAGQQTPDQWIDNVRSTIGAKVADWLSEHKEYVTDGKLNAKAIAFANNYALVEEGALNSDEFIEALNARFFPEEDDDGDGGGAEGDRAGRMTAVVEDEPRRPAAKAAPKATHAAPVSRSGDYYSSRNPNGSRIKLSPALASIARELGMKPEDYALNARKEIKNGKLPANFLDPDYQPGV